MINVAEDIGIEIPTEEEVEDVLRELDVNNDGEIDVMEFEVLIT